MRTKSAIFAIIVAGGILAQGLSTGAIFEFVAAAGTEAVAAVSNGIDAVDPAVRDMLAPALAGVIVDSRDAAIGRGVEGVPQEIRAALIDFVPLEILDDVRWRIEGSTPSIEQSLLSMSYSSAVTLDHVILFASPEYAADPKLWAHELFHVMQYKEWGIDGFVVRYLADRAAVERDAWEFRWQWMKATNRVPQP